MAALPGIGIFGTNAAVHLLTPVLREKVGTRGNLSISSLVIRWLESSSF